MASMMPEIFWRWVGGPRFSITVGAGLVHTVLVWFGKISGDQFVLLTTITVGAYIGAATTSKIMEKKNVEAP